MLVEVLLVAFHILKECCESQRLDNAKNVHEVPEVTSLQLVHLIMQVLAVFDTHDESRKWA